MKSNIAIAPVGLLLLLSPIVVGCLKINDPYNPIPKTADDLKAEEVLQQCGDTSDRVTDGTSWDDYKACAVQRGANDKVVKHLKFMWDGSVYASNNRIQRTCYKVVSTSASEVESCMHGCEIPTANCIATTEPMTSQRLACLRQDENCKRSCAIAGRQGGRVKVPCKQ